MLELYDLDKVPVELPWIEIGEADKRMDLLDIFPDHLLQGMDPSLVEITT